MLNRAFFYNFIWRFPFPLLVQGKMPSKRWGETKNFYTAMCISADAHHLKFST